MPNVRIPIALAQDDLPTQVFFPRPALSRPSLRLTPAERRDRDRLERIGGTPVLERTPADLVFEDAFDIGEAYPSAVVDAIAGLIAGVRAAERTAGRAIASALRVETAELRPPVAAAVREALRPGVEL